MKLSFKFSEVKPRIFFLDFKDPYHMCMMFLRYQEYYESPSPRFRGKPFTLVEFMDWYAHKYGNGIFTYPRDWAGFNIPAYVIKEVVSKIITDHNAYDEAMFEVFKKCRAKYPDGNFYLIGAMGERGAMRHEIAHGLFYTCPEYRKEAISLVKKLKPSLRKRVNKVLKSIGYTPKVYVDETQAYFSTGVPKGFKISLKDEQKPFIELFNKYYKNKE